MLSNLTNAMERAANKKKTENLRSYYKQNFGMDKLPGEASLNMDVFLHQIRRKSQHIAASSKFTDGQTLQGKITTSTMNVKQIATGKRVMGVFQAENTRLSDSSKHASHATSAEGL